MQRYRMSDRARRSFPLLLAGGIAAVIIGLSIFLIILPINRPGVLLYGLDEREARAIAGLLGGVDGVRIVSQADGAAPRVAGNDLMVFRAGTARASSAVESAPLPSSLLESTVPSLRRSVASGGGYVAMPIFLDHYELAWDTDRLSSLGFSGVSSLSGMERAMRAWTDRARGTSDIRERTSTAFIAAGGDDENLLLLLSALCVAEGGPGAYRAVSEALMSGTGLAGLEGMVIALDTEGKAITFGALLDRLSAWRRAGYMHPEWTSFTEGDVRSFMENGQALMSAHTLSFHRSVDYKAISRYSSGRFPGSGDASGTAIVAPLTLAAIVGKPSRMERSMAMMRALANPAAAREAAIVTGRATTLAASPAPDVQAADALAFAAAADTVVAGWYRDAFRDATGAHRFAEEVRNALRR